VSSKPKQDKTTHPDIKIQPPLLALIHVALGFVLTWLIPLRLVVPPLLQTGGFLLVIIGFLLGIGALIAFRRARTARNSGRSVSPLVTFGIYRLTRNPVYLGFVLMLIGILLNAGSYWGMILTPMMVVLFNRLVIEREEEYLLHQFGDEFRSYQLKVRRWI
jgi:protein-S-isoprenylcysteine O-methyltransferase Ste14